MIKVIVLDLDDTLIDTSSLEPLRSAGRWRDIPRYFNGCVIYQDVVGLKWFTEFGHLNRGDMLTSEQHRCHNEKKKFQRRV